jgi:acetyl esterase/lipase
MIDGRVMDLRAQVVSALGARGPKLHTGSPARGRKLAAGSFAMSNAPRRPGVAVRDATIPGPGGPVPVRHYTPATGSTPRPGIVYFHMGGWVIGNLETCDHFCSLLAERVGAHVVSVDYRLAPEHRFPAALEDGFAAYEWVGTESHSLGIDVDRLAVMGDSAGGCMTAVVCQEMRRRGRPQPRLQVPIYAATDLAREDVGSRRSCANVYPLTLEIMHWFLGHWLASPAQASDVRTSPLREPDLSGLAPAYVVTAGFDILRDEGEEYARALDAAAVPTTYRCFDDLPHAFTALSGLVPAAGAANEEIAEVVREALAPPAPG